MPDRSDTIVQSRSRDCPACGVPTVRLPVFTTRRRHPVTCTNCGVKLERVLPGVPYYTLSFVIGMLAQVAALPLAFFMLSRRWGWVAVTIVVVVLINLAVSAFLNARTRVELVDPADARKDKPFRWYPKSPGE